MPQVPSPEALAAEFDCLMSARRHHRPAATPAAVLAAYADLRQQIALLHGRYGPQHEPSNVFRAGER